MCCLQIVYRINKKTQTITHTSTGTGTDAKRSTLGARAGFVSRRWHVPSRHRLGIFSSGLGPGLIFVRSATRSPRTAPPEPLESRSILRRDGAIEHLVSHTMATNAVPSSRPASSEVLLRDVDGVASRVSAHLLTRAADETASPPRRGRCPRSTPTHRRRTRSPPRGGAPFAATTAHLRGASRFLLRLLFCELTLELGLEPRRLVRHLQRLLVDLVGGLFVQRALEAFLRLLRSTLRPCQPPGRGNPGRERVAEAPESVMLLRG